MAEVFGTATYFIITEQSGDKRELRLGGRALPYRPVTFSGTQRMETTWYPGNPEATIQVFGAAEDETTIRGQWKDRFVQQRLASGEFTAIALLNNKQLGSVRDLVVLVDDMRRKGQEVIVSWDEIVRRGVIAKFIQTWERRQDVEWELTFQWLSQGDARQPSVVAERDIFDTRADFSTITDALNRARAAVQPIMEPKFAVEFGDTLLALQDQIDEIGSTVSSLAEGALEPPAALGRVASIMSSIQESSAGIVSTIVARTTIQSFDPDVFVDQPFGFYLDKLGTLRDAQDTARLSRHKAARQAFELSQQLQQPAIATFTARAGQDLRDASVAFFGTPDEWRTIADYNDLDGSELTAGQVVSIPLSGGLLAGQNLGLR